MDVKTFTLDGIFPGTVMDMVYDLRRSGLVQGTDFDFKYVPPIYDWKTHEGRDRYAEFKFYNPKWATWFALKYIS